MDGSAQQQPSSGFPPHIQQAFEDATVHISQNSRARGRGRGRAPGHMRRGRGAYQPVSLDQQRTNARSWGAPFMDNPTDMNSFPPLGTSRQNFPAAPDAGPASGAMFRQQPPFGHHYHPHPYHTQYHTQPMPQGSQQPDYQAQQYPQREFFLRARGNQYRGPQNHRSVHYHQQPISGQPPPQNANDFGRPPPAQRTLFTPGAHPYFSTAEEQREFHKRIMNQSDFLNHLASQSLGSNQLTMEEQKAKETFRKELERIAQRVVMDGGKASLKFDPQHIQLRLYGSLGSGFGVAGCDMDLLLAFPQDEGPIGDIEIDSRRWLEKGLLDAGIGARLLTNTRVPILRVCQKPSPELLKNLRAERAKWEQSLGEDGSVVAPLPELTETQRKAAEVAMIELDLDAHTVPLPKSPQLDHAKLEYTGDCGIQSDINFSNYVALHNTRLLKTYGSCDPRVRQVGIFVKSWAKARDINTPYRGTLSSYGYILMVLHYLMNVVDPPVIPNLQEIAKLRDFNEGKEDVHLVEGFDVRFVRDMNDVQQIVQSMPRNHESVGSLLRGFFWYYASAKSFNWSQSIISIRSQGGLIPKKAKGWTEAKWAGGNNHIRLRYLLAIEDPFELEHNVARTVGHSGIVAIRDEFRLAWGIIDNVQHNDETKLWFWLNSDGQRIDADQMIARIESRGDLLRKDQDYHRQKTRQMRQDLEATEQALRNIALEKTAEEKSEAVTTGMSNPEPKVAEQGNRHPDYQSDLALIHDGAAQILNPTQAKTPTKPQASNWDDADYGDTQQPTSEIRWTGAADYAVGSGNENETLPSSSIDWDVAFTESELGPEYRPRQQNDPSSEPNGAVPSLEHVAQYESEQGFDQEGTVESRQPKSSTIQHSKPQNSNTMQLQTGINSLPFIAWDSTTADGRWLLDRDNKIRAGWPRRRHVGFHAQLDEFFPYNPNMSVRELAEKNELLRERRWRAARLANIRAQSKSGSLTGPVPQSEGDGEMRQQQSAPEWNAETDTTSDSMSKKPNVAWSERVSADEEPQQKSLTNNHRRHSTLKRKDPIVQAENPRTDPTESKNRKSATRNLRRRGHYRNSNKRHENLNNLKAETESNPTTMTSIDNDHSKAMTNTDTNVTDTMNTISSSQYGTWNSHQEQSQTTSIHHSPPTPPPPLPPQEPHTSITTSSEPTHQHHHQQPSTSITTSFDTQTPASDLTMTPTPSTRPPPLTKHLIEIYQAFHTQTDRSTPIPKPTPQPTSTPVQPDFQLDLRQLADLETIRQGGNGCMRNESQETERIQ